MTQLGLNLSEYVNGVAERHAETSRRLFPGYKVHAITNGVHPFTWVCESVRRIYDQYVPSWCHEPELLVRVDGSVPDALLWEAHMHAKRALIERIRTSSLADLIPIVYLPNYNLDLARLLVAGADIWLNTPLPPLEASGTSGMKAAFNGVPNLGAISRNASYFNSHRMMRRYATEAYLR